MTKKELLKKIDFGFLIKLNLCTKLLQKKKYFSKKDFVEGFARQLKSDECQFVYEKYKEDFSPYYTAEKFLTNYRPTGDFLKRDYIFNELIGNKGINIHQDIIFCEFPVKNTRTDISRINGYSYAYEIKSVRDNTNRATWQTEQFLDVFDYAFLIVDDGIENVELNDSVGVIEIERENGIIEYDETKKPKRQNSHNSIAQLDLLQKTELLEIDLNINFNNKPSRKKIQNEIIKNYTNDEINKIFKNTLKKRYLPLWLKTVKEMAS